MKEVLLDSIRDHGWSWLVALLIAVAIAVLATPLREVGEWLVRLARPPAANAYVLTAGGTPLVVGLVRNSRGAGVELDDQGCFKPLDYWGSGCGLMIYGPTGPGGDRPFLGEYTLRARENGEWEPIRLHP